MSPGWLEPLLDRIARDSTTVVCPTIDVLDDTTLELKYGSAKDIQVGGFSWDLTVCSVFCLLGSFVAYSDAEKEKLDKTLC